jgi:hypothetical protein
MIDGGPFKEGSRAGRLTRGEELACLAEKRPNIRIRCSCR